MFAVCLFACFGFSRQGFSVALEPILELALVDRFIMRIERKKMSKGFENRSYQEYRKELGSGSTRL